MRSTVEYSSSVWDPHLKKAVVDLEKINCRAARFVMNDYKLQSCVTEMLHKLEWPSLEHRRKKVTQGLLAVPSSYLTLADSRTRANHICNFKNISASSSAYKIHSFLEQFCNGTIYTRTLLKCHLWAAFRIVCNHSPSVYSTLVRYPTGSLPSI